ncbi:MAG: methylated-DNA--[protein]-cysteine S-methyltransferase [Pseudomonadota bacterium]
MKIQQGSELFQAIVATPFGAMGIRSDGAQVTEMVYLPSHYAEKEAQDAVAALAAGQVLRYCADADFRFALPLAAVGTAYQRRVWDAICAIPRGELRTYGELAKFLASAPRAIGQACGNNWFPLAIPCHRVTGASGLGGFAHHDDPTGFHLNVKRWLLAHEGHSEYAWQQTTLL